ncbi:carbohydrate kinase [Nocardia huaxiensis]|uniref:Carbohydrate kinase n=1 Tax=Nocardia huaxiensis TaxID=2755382 RepID=A0A7D6VJ96_9NOCA|nr:carbohydrate kinase [Nocardia huaxiensis]
MNPAYDVTYRVQRMERGAAQRVQTVEQRAGGKGVNVARVLTGAGIYAVASGLADLEFAEFAAGSVPVDFVNGLPWVRRTLVVHEADGTVTGLWEPGAAVRDSSVIELLMTRIRVLLPQLRGMVVSGSLPQGVRPSLPAELARMAVGAGVPVICDVDGAALRYAVRVPGVVLMPNAEELRELTGFATHGPVEVVRAVRPLLADGVRAVVATRGAEGMVAVTASGAWRAHLTESITGNPTGAGDAAAAAVIAHLAGASFGAHDLPNSLAVQSLPANGAVSQALVPESRAQRAVPQWPELLAEAVATSAAAVAAPVAGEVDLSLRARLLPTVRVEPVCAPDPQEFSCP